MKRGMLALMGLLLVAAACDHATPTQTADIGTVRAEAAWDYLVTGSGTFYAGTDPVTIDVSLTEGLKGGTKGQIQYTRTTAEGEPQLLFHVAVDEFRSLGGGYYEMCGVANRQDGALGIVFDGDRVGMSILDVDGGMDRLRIGPGLACDGTMGLVATLAEGDYKVREDS